MTAPRPRTVQQYLIATASPVRRAELLAEERHAEAVQREERRRMRQQGELARERVWRRE